MYAEDLVIDDDAQREEIKHVGKVVPDVGIAVLARTFRVEAVRLGDTAGLVVAADEVDSVGVSKLEAHEERYRLNAEHSAIDIVAWREGSVSRKHAGRGGEGKSLPRKR